MISFVIMIITRLCEINILLPWMYVKIRVLMPYQYLECQTRDSRLSFHTKSKIYFDIFSNNNKQLLLHHRHHKKKLGMNFQLVRKYPLHKCNIAKVAICKILFATTRKIMWIITESYLKKENTFHNFKAESFVLWPWLKYFVRNSNCKKKLFCNSLRYDTFIFFHSVRHLTNCLPRHLF